MFKEDEVVLTADLPVEKLRSGDVGTVVHIHRQREAFEVRFIGLDVRTDAVATATAS